MKRFCFVIVQDKERYLLVQKHMPVINGKEQHAWNFLREELHDGELPQDAAKRIANEKVGLCVSLTDTPIKPPVPKNPRVSAFYVLPKSTNVTLDKDLISFKWLTKKELRTFAVPENFAGPQSLFIAQCVLEGKKYSLETFWKESV